IEEFLVVVDVDLIQIEASVAAESAGNTCLLAANGVDKANVHRVIARDTVGNRQCKVVRVWQDPVFGIHAIVDRGSGVDACCSRHSRNDRQRTSRTAGGNSRYNIWQ